MKFLAVVKSVKAKTLLVSLPNNLIVSVSAKDINDRFKDLAMKESTENDSDDSDDDEEEPLSSLVPDLRDTFRENQFLPCILTNFFTTAKGKKRISASINPSVVNGHTDSFVQNQVLTANIASVEDHGYVLDLGLGKRAFMPFSESEGPLLVNQGCMIQVVDVEGSGLVQAKLLDFSSSASDHISANLDSFESFIPGMLVKGKVKAVTESNVQVTIEKVFNGYINYFHFGFPVLDEQILGQTFAVGKQIRVSVIYVDPISRKLGLSLNPWVLNPSVSNVSDLMGSVFDDFEILKHDVNWIQSTSAKAQSIPCFIHASLKFLHNLQ